MLSDAVPTQRALEELRQRWMDRTFRAFRPAPPQAVCLLSLGVGVRVQAEKAEPSAEPEPGPSPSPVGPRVTLHLGKWGLVAPPSWSCEGSEYADTRKSQLFAGLL